MNLSAKVEKHAKEERVRALATAGAFAAARAQGYAAAGRTRGAAGTGGGGGAGDARSGGAGGVGGACREGVARPRNLVRCPNNSDGDYLLSSVFSTGGGFWKLTRFLFSSGSNPARRMAP